MKLLFVLIIVAIVFVSGCSNLPINEKNKTNALQSLSPSPEITISKQIKTTEKPAQPVQKSAIFDVPCKSNPDIIFKNSFAPTEEIANIVPSGSAAGEEIKAHSYVDLAVESIPVYAPGDMELVSATYYNEPPTFKVPSTYLLAFQASCEVIFMLDHITDPVQKIRDAAPKNPQESTLGRNLIDPPIKFNAGELIGYTKGGGTQKANPPINRFDLGLYITTHRNKFVNQDRYMKSHGWKAINSVCVYDYFSDQLKGLYYSKFGDGPDKQAPNAICRNPDQDIEGTLAGAWFFSENGSSVEPHVGIALDLRKKSVIVVGLSNPISLDNSSPTFRDPAQIITEHCYFNLNGNRVLYFRIISPIKAEVYDSVSASGCPAAFPASGTIFLYR